MFCQLSSPGGGMFIVPSCGVYMRGQPRRGLGFLNEVSIYYSTIHGAESVLNIVFCAWK